MSSQYGGSFSISYTMYNLAGRPHIYPLARHFSYSAVPRTFGTWWDHLSQWTPGRSPKNPEWFQSRDFVEILFDEPVFPNRVSVFETSHPGYVVRILAKSWDKGEDFDFSPPIHPPGFATNVLRLEFDCSLSDYYMELDAVVLHGIPVDIIRRNTSKSEDVAESERLQKTLIDALLPRQIIELILSHLTLPELCRLAQCSRTLRNYCYNPSMYKHLDLKPFWPSLCEEDLLALKPRLTHTRSLGLSWTGNHGRFSPAVLGNCWGLAHPVLFVQVIPYVSLESLIKLCPNLRDLDLSSCDQIPPRVFKQLSSLQRLQRLVLYRTQIDVSSLRSLCSFYSLAHVRADGGTLSEMVREMPRLRRLVLTANRSVSDTDLESLANYCPLLEHLDILGTVIEGIMGTDVDGSKRITEVARSGRKIKIASRNKNGTRWSAYLLLAEQFTFCSPLKGWIFIRT
uniref:F-box and leucine-rich repeat protein 4 n=1 Tax=Eptatretus burgeri TaxID=7764 RepID=A0A8C4QYT3_EPTBU